LIFVYENQDGLRGPNVSARRQCRSQPLDM
jgi:hypothetical protein